MGLESPDLFLGNVWYNSSPRNRAERIWSPTAQGLLWEQTAAELAVEWHSQADIARSQRCTESRGTPLEKHEVFCARVKPWSPLSHLQP